MTPLRLDERAVIGKKRELPRFPMLSFIALMLVACEPPAPPVPGALERSGAVIKVVNGQNVTQGMIDAQLAALPPKQQDQIKAGGQMARFEEQVVLGELLYQEALKLKLDADPKVKAALAFADRNALAGALIEATIATRVNDQAIQAWYDGHAVQFVRPQVKARHILFAKEAKADAETALAEIKADRTRFAAIAIEKSTDKGSGKEGGELGWFEKGRMVEEFANAAFAANKGDLVGPVESKFGFHIIEVEDKRESIPLDEVKDKLKDQVSKEVVEAYIEELKKAATIVDAVAAPAAGAVVTPAPDAAPAAPPAAPAPH